MRHPLPVLLALTLALGLLAHRIAGPLAIPPFGFGQLTVVSLALMNTLIAAVLLALADSVRHAGRFSSPQTGALDLRALWRATRVMPLTVIPLIMIAAWGIGMSSNLAEVYRASRSGWRDPLLWAIEGRLLTALSESHLNLPYVWDFIYQMFWLEISLALAVLARAGRCRELGIALCAVVIAFHATRYLAIAFPSAGPIFHRPDLFNHPGTLTSMMAETLRAYMRGALPQSGLIPGTQAMPSLHVGIAWLALTLLARQWRWTLRITLPCFILNWMSTVLLGWHYLLDGVGGMALMWCALRLSERLLRIPEAVDAPRALERA